MVLARPILDEGKRIALGALASRLFHSEHRIEYEKDNLADKINQYRIHTQNENATIGDIARRYNLAGGLESYTDNLLTIVKEYLAQLRQLTDYIRNFNAEQQKGSAYELNLYAAVQKAYTLMSKLMGYPIKDESTNKYVYLSDLVNEYMHEIGNMNKKLERILEIASGFDTHSSKFIYATSKIAARWLSQQILEKEGIPFAGLEAIVNQKTQPFAELKKKANKIFVEYESLVKSLNKAYASDLQNGIYAVVG